MSSQMTDGCPFCKAVSSCSTGAGLSQCIENTPLYESQSFLVFPALGPVVPGHVLVVTKQHRPGFSSLSQRVLQEYEELADTLLPRIPFAIAQPTEAEHGATDSEPGGATVVHAHMHWFPVDVDILPALNDIMQPSRSEVNVVDLAMMPAVPYVFVRRKGMYSHLFVDHGIPSQLLRKLVSEAASDGEWDWHKQAHPQWVVDTVARWRETI